MTQIRDMYKRKQLTCFFLDFLLRKMADTIGNILPDCQVWKKRIVLKHKANVSLLCRQTDLFGRIEEYIAVKLNIAFVWTKQTGNTQ